MKDLTAGADLQSAPLNCGSSIRLQIVNLDNFHFNKNPEVKNFLTPFQTLGFDTSFKFRIFDLGIEN